jgi:hypothetical protein
MSLYQHCRAEIFRFEVRDELDADLARELESCWETARSTIGERQFVVDVTLVSRWDEAGMKVLEKMRAAGIEISSRAKDQKLVEHLDGKAGQPVEEPGRTAARPGWGSERQARTA